MTSIKTCKTARCDCGRFMPHMGAYSARGGQSGKCARCTVLDDASTGWNRYGMTRSWNR